MKVVCLKHLENLVLLRLQLVSGWAKIQYLVIEIAAFTVQGQRLSFAFLKYQQLILKKFLQVSLKPKWKDYLSKNMFFCYKELLILHRVQGRFSSNLN